MKQPVMTWTNVENYMGAVFVWTYGGRPEVIGCIGSHQAGAGRSNVFHEFHSLCLEPLQSVRFGRGQQEWTPAKPGVALPPSMGRPCPATSNGCA